MTEINKYLNGKIYKIVCNKTNLVYIGSTVEKYLCNRLKGHRKHYNEFLNGKNHYTSSFKILENGDYYIELVESYPCNSKDELLVRERYYFDNIECVNKFKPLITDDEKKEYRKEYRQVHKEKMKEYLKKYYKEHDGEIKEKQKKNYQNNKEEIKEQVKQYYEDNKEKINEHKKQHYQTNKEKISENKKIKFICECGSECRLSDKLRHEKSKKHINFINNNF